MTALMPKMPIVPSTDLAISKPLPGRVDNLQVAPFFTENIM